MDAEIITFRFLGGPQDGDTAHFPKRAEPDSDTMKFMTVTSQQVMPVGNGEFRNIYVRELVEGNTITYRWKG